MKKTLLALSFTGLITVGNATELKTDVDKVSYSLGFGMGYQLSELPKEIATLDNEKIIQGVKDALAKKTSKVDEKDIKKLMTEFSEKERNYYETVHVEKLKKEGEENLATGKKLLEENKVKEGVKVTESGLQYKVIQSAEGDKPKKTDKVKVHYKGTLSDGKEFDSSYTRGKPATFPLNAVIPGWTEGLQLMPVGSKYQFVIPSDLAYGSDAPASIGPNQVLTFEVELLEIVK